MALLGLTAQAGIVNAAQGYPPATTVTVNISGANISVVDGNITVLIGGEFTFSGDGFDAGEGIEIVISGPSGLRSTGGLTQLNTAALVPDATADGNGKFATAITLNSLGITTISAVGRASGKSASLTVTVVAPGGEAGTMVAAVGTGTAGVAKSTADDGLASTGASIAGSLAIGFFALFAGLALLFYGTRGVRRRRSADATW
jgi:hypothetical protein